MLNVKACLCTAIPKGMHFLIPNNPIDKLVTGELPSTFPVYHNADFIPHYTVIFTSMAYVMY